MKRKIRYDVEWNIKGKFICGSTVAESDTIVAISDIMPYECTANNILRFIEDNGYLCYSEKKILQAIIDKGFGNEVLSLR